MTGTSASRDSPQTPEEIFGSEIPRAEVKLWMERAREQTLETLPAFLKEVHEVIPSSYGNCVHKLAISAIAATWASDKEVGGITGFMAGCVMWEYITSWMSNENPQKILDYGNLLYPQYRDHFTSISPDTWKWVQEQARTGLSNPLMAESVRVHMLGIVAGKVPFGLKIKED